MSNMKVLDRPKAAKRETDIRWVEAKVRATDLLRSTPPVAVAEEESIETKIRKLEMGFEHFIQTTLRSRLTSKETEEMATLSQASLQNIITIQRLAKQIEETISEG